ncbi:hypothetical protein MSM1_07870 [Mycobacterium sp. SM1]|uniref:hypothetical protein n=1 Tax=Mycobacterium sp. SM1 TaxID=2816243 RepID=UPI001BCF5397|nr:hypothetical protein [Mycobacterium sp. SM1]MBS4728263.1 hypothetical protein [Mycobacterium sp. SM1]
MQQMMPLVLSAAALGLLLAFVLRRLVRRGSPSDVQLNRRMQMLYAGAMLICAGFLTLDAITTERLRYVNIAVATMSVVAAVVQLRKRHQQRT